MRIFTGRLRSNGAAHADARKRCHFGVLAARAGGYHFKHVDGLWRDTKDGVEFFERLSREASTQAGKALTFSS